MDSISRDLQVSESRVIDRKARASVRMPDWAHDVSIDWHVKAESSAWAIDPRGPRVKCAP